MNLWHEYVIATTVAEALQAMNTSPGQAVPLAGGTDLLLDLQQGRHAPVHTIVDLTGIQEMRALEIRQDELFVGAAVPLNKIARNPLVNLEALALVEACILIGGPQVRNVATLGGNVAHALPAADGTIALVALGAQAEVASMQGVRRVPLLELFRGPGKSTLEIGRELLVGFYLPRRLNGQASAFKRIMRPQGVALPILNLSIWLERSSDEISDIRIAVGPAGPTPWRATEAERVLSGLSLNAASLNLALEAILDQAKFRTSPQRASAGYRRNLVGVLLKDTMETAWERAGLASED